jgi:hypothetical protein
VDDIQGLEDQQTKVVECNVMQDLGWVVVSDLADAVGAANG